MDILDIFLDILLKPPQPLMGLFYPKFEILVFKQDYFFSLNVLSYLHFCCLLKQGGAIKKMEPFTWRSFLCYFSAFLSAFKSNLWKENRRSHVKIYKFIFKKEKMKRDENETLC